jgi:hypothetical protein
MTTAGLPPGWDSFTPMQRQRAAALMLAKSLFAASPPVVVHRLARWLFNAEVPPE